LVASGFHRISHNELPKKKRPPQVAASLFSSSPLRDVAYCTKPLCHPVKRMSADED
jgi:hypothetical protein